MDFSQRLEQSLSDFSHAELQVAARILHAIRTTRFGSVTLTLHEGKVVEIHKTEKIRMVK